MGIATLARSNSRMFFWDFLHKTGLCRDRQSSCTKKESDCYRCLPPLAYNACVGKQMSKI